jgi:hypothetical protein
MKHFTSISAITLSSVTSIFGRTSAGERPQALPRVASSALLCLALAAAVTGCIGQESPADEELVDSTDLAVTAPINPSDMWSNSVWFVGNSGSADPYSQVRFQYTNSGGATDFTVPINSNGAFTKYMNTGSPYNGDVIRATWSGPGLDDVGCNFVFRYYGGAVYTFAEMGCVVTPRVARVVLNEILVNEPGSATAGEFVELVNIGDGTANLGGWTLSDRVFVRHTFAAGTTLLPGKALVVFGGASAIPAGLSNAVAASSGALSLNNTGDDVNLHNANGEFQLGVGYGDNANPIDGVSMNISPEGTDSGGYALHSTLSAAPNSPGVRTSGAAW